MFLSFPFKFEIDVDRHLASDVLPILSGSPPVWRCTDHAYSLFIKPLIHTTQNLDIRNLALLIDYEPDKDLALIANDFKVARENGSALPRNTGGMSHSA